jgi:hypothetical protein
MVKHFVFWMQESFDSVKKLFSKTRHLCEQECKDTNNSINTSQVLLQW